MSAFSFGCGLRRGREEDALREEDQRLNLAGTRALVNLEWLPEAGGGSSGHFGSEACFVTYGYAGSAPPKRRIGGTRPRSSRRILLRTGEWMAETVQWAPEWLASADPLARELASSGWELHLGSLVFQPRDEKGAFTDTETPIRTRRVRFDCGNTTQFLHSQGVY